MWKRSAKHPAHRDCTTADSSPFEAALGQALLPGWTATGHLVFLLSTLTEDNYTSRVRELEKLCERFGLVVYAALHQSLFIAVASTSHRPTAPPPEPLHLVSFEMPTLKDISKAAADLAGAQARLATLTARRRLYQQEADLLDRSSQRAEQEAQEAEALAASKRESADVEAAALHEKTADLLRLQQEMDETIQTIEGSSGVLHAAHRMRMFQEPESDDASSPHASSPHASSPHASSPPPNKIRVKQCKTCGTANSSRFRQDGTLCNACFLKNKPRHPDEDEDEDEDDFNQTLQL
ncbi:hypothetical protein A4X13_0g8157 [Tilletia indica]|uniref:Uncharacterized protein n=1 Tax=Tilletia indica TaxID=43049 RepID=A0A8T8SFW9_9BASI|nr:hypothetical protein A4X13_0g8157 [Tilletia indica]